jgi:hypothetical protein
MSAEYVSSGVERQARVVRGAAARGPTRPEIWQKLRPGNVMARQALERGRSCTL